MTDEPNRLRASVRPIVTYGVVAAYVCTACALSGWLVLHEQVDAGLGVLAALGSLAGPIVGFWFGSRRPEGDG